MKYRYEIIWTTDDDLVPTHHHTYIDVSKIGMFSALRKFHRICFKLCRGLSCPCIVSCNFLGGVIENRP